MKNYVVLYALSTCAWCKKTHFFLEDNNIEHDVIAVDLLTDEEKKVVREELGKYNPRRSFPTVVIGNEKVVVGYEEDLLKEYLNL